MKKLLSILIIFSMLFVGCNQNIKTTNAIIASEKNSNIKSNKLEQQENRGTEMVSNEEQGDSTPYNYEVKFDSLNDDKLNRYIEDYLYQELVSKLDDEKYYVENVKAIYISQEYIDELAFNSEPNIFFGYTLEEVDKAFKGKRYVFTLGEDSTTVVKEFEEYDDIYKKAIKNVAIGTGVILICVTVSLVTGGTGTAPAVNVVFATAAKTGTIAALSSGALGGVAAGIVTGIETGNMDEAIKNAAIAGSDGFKWGAITGVIAGGVGKLVSLRNLTLNGLTMNEAAIIQKTSKYPLNVIREIHSMDEFRVYQNAGLKPYMINGQSMLIKSDINVNLVDKLGKSNMKRMQLGLAPLDNSGIPLELHHIGQKSEGTLAVLTKVEHDAKGLHGFKTISEINRTAFVKQKRQIWKTIAKNIEEGLIK